MKATPKSVLPTPAPPPRKPPTKRCLEVVEPMEAFLSNDTINAFADINETHAPTGFSCNKTSDHIVFYNLSYVDGFPVVLESIKVDSNLHVQLRYNGHPVPLPAFFTVGRNAKLTRFSQLNEFPNAIRIVFFSMDFFFLNNTRKVLAWQKIQPSLGLHSRGTQIIKLKFIIRHT